MAELIDKSALYNKVAELEELAFRRTIDTPTNSPCYIRYVSQLNERTALKHLISDAQTVTEAEIRAKAISEFAEKLKERLKCMQMVDLQGEDVCPCSETGEECPHRNSDVGCQYCAMEQTIKDLEEIAEQLKGE